MLVRALAVASLFLMTALAGCLGGEEAPQDPVDTQNTNTSNNVIDANESTTAPDGRGKIQAFEETNKTESGVGGMEHTHDYWQGRERIDVAYIDSGMIPFPVYPCRSGRADSGGDCYNPGTSIADYDMATAAEGIETPLIFEGTKQVVLTATVLEGPADGAPATTDLNFDFITASDEPGAWRPGGVLKLNEPVTIDIKPTEADMPHQVKSLWLFRLYTTDATWIDFNITITAVRGYDVVNWPPHPDLYADRTERLIYDGAFEADSRGTVDSITYGSDSQWFHPEKVISWGTDRLEIEITNVNLQTQVPVDPAGFLLEVHNASKPPLLGHGAQYGARLSDPSSDGTSYKFTVNTAGDEESYDTPYAQGSRWGFRFVPDFDTVGGACIDDEFLQQILVGCQVVPWTISYNIKIVAYGHSTGGDAGGM